MTRKAMTVKQTAFCHEWLTGEKTGKRFNASAAWVAAGFSENATHNSYKLLRHPLVKAYIQKAMATVVMSPEEVMARFTEIARSEPGVMVKLNDNNRLDISSIDVIANRRFIKGFSFDSNGNPKVEFHDPVDALKMMAKLQGMGQENLGVYGNGPNGSIPVAIGIQFIGADGSVWQPPDARVQATETPALTEPLEEEPEEDFSEFDE